MYSHLLATFRDGWLVCLTHTISAEILSLMVIILCQGYLGGVLRQRCGLKVVGVEREGERVAAARRRAPSVFSTVELDISDSHHCQTQLSSLLDDIIRM